MPEEAVSPLDFSLDFFNFSTKTKKIERIIERKSYESRGIRQEVLVDALPA